RRGPGQPDRGGDAPGRADRDVGHRRLDPRGARRRQLRHGPGGLRDGVAGRPDLARSDAGGPPGVTTRGAGRWQAMRVQLNYATPEATHGGRPATGGGHRRGQSPAWKPRATRWGRGLAGLAILLLLAQALGSSGVLSRSVLPLASTVL